MDDTQKLIKPAEYAEKFIIKHIVSGKWKKGDPLPPERDLADLIGITRPTLRETLKRLSTEGWITIRHGKPTLVNDFIHEGSIGIIKTLIKHCDLIPDTIIRDWLEFRTILLPQLAQKAANNNPDKILNLLKQKPQSNASAREFAWYDWQLQDMMVSLSNNSVARLIFNDVKEPYLFLAEKYFSLPQNRQASSRYYTNLQQTISQQPHRTEDVVKQAMSESMANYASIISDISSAPNNK